MSISAIVLIIIGVIVFFGLLGFGAWFWMARKITKAQGDMVKRFFDKDLI